MFKVIEHVFEFYVNVDTYLNIYGEQTEVNIFSDKLDINNENAVENSPFYTTLNDWNNNTHFLNIA